MIELTIEQLVIAEKALVNLSKEKLPIAAAYKIGKIMKAVAAELEDIDKAKKDAAEKYGQRDSEGKLIIDKESNMIPIIPEKRNEFTEEMNKLFKSTCSLNVTPINLKLLEGVKLSSQELNTIELFLIDSE